MDTIVALENLNNKNDKINLMAKREDERQLNLQKKKGDKDLLTANNEKLDFFEAIFAEKQGYIENLINDSETIPSNKLPAHFDTIFKEILTLQKYVAASNIFLINYHLQRCQSTLQDLTARAKALENVLLPKKKFSFKNKVKETEDVKSFKDVRDEADSKPKPKFGCIINTCGFFDKKNESLRMSSTEILKKDVVVENLDTCTVVLQGSPSTLHLNYLKNCRVFTGPVSTSIFAENCENCILVIACQQLRLHSSRNVSIYLHVTSRAIMEDCKDIKIAPYNWTYDGIDMDFQGSSLDRQTNNWKCIDDFNWLSEKHSPNWEEMKPEERTQKWDVNQ